MSDDTVPLLSSDDAKYMRSRNIYCHDLNLKLRAIQRGLVITKSAAAEYVDQGMIKGLSIYHTLESDRARLELEIHQLRESLGGSLPEWPDASCDECGGIDDKCPIRCYVRRGRELLRSA